MNLIKSGAVCIQHSILIIMSSERELVILERQIRRNLKRSSRTKQRNSSVMAAERTDSHLDKDSSNYTESFTSDCVEGGGAGDGNGSSSTSNNVHVPFFPVANIDGIVNKRHNVGSRNVSGGGGGSGSYHYYHCRLGCPPSVAWWKSRKSTSASMIVSVPVRRLKKRKKKCLKCKSGQM